MSWVPVFQIGLWNAWILMLVVPLHPLMMLAVDKAVGTGEIFKKMGDVPNEKGEKRDFVLFMVIWVLLIAYSVFLPLRLGTVWFFVGPAIWLVGLMMFLTAIVNIATTPRGQPFRKGTYRFSRHPMYISESLIFWGLGVAAASWVFVLLSVVIMVLLNSQAVAEERSCLGTYGKDYKEYMNRTPRWIGIPKSR